MFVRLWLCNQDYLKLTIPEKFHVDNEHQLVNKLKS